MPERKRCEYCAEEIRSEAKRCPYCRSRIRKFEAVQWHRGHGDARLAGVASAVAHAMSLPVGLVRLGFVAACFVHLAGPTAYAVLWAVIPEARGVDSPLQKGLARAQKWAAILAGTRSDDSARPPQAQSGGSLGPATVLDGTDGER